jgi:uncharacterized phiE125 gp8 family phage protein
MALRMITPPAIEPINLDEAKIHLRVDHNDDDALISSLISSARDYAERWTARAFITQTWELVIDEFPANEIELPLPPLRDVISIKYDDGAGAEQTLSTSEYEVDTVSQPGWVVPALGGWPATFNGINAVRIRYNAGYGPSGNSPEDLGSDVPASIRSAILLQVGMLYANRESVVVGTVVNQVPVGGIMNLLRRYRVALGMA